MFVLALLTSHSSLSVTTHEIGRGMPYDSNGNWWFESNLDSWVVSHSSPRIDASKLDIERDSVRLRVTLAAMFHFVAAPLGDSINDVWNIFGFFDPLPHSCPHLELISTKNSRNIPYYICFSMNPSPLRCRHHTWKPLFPTSWATVNEVKEAGAGGRAWQ